MLINNKNRVNLVLLHHFVNLYYFSIWAYALGMWSHDLCYCMLEEIVSKFFHGSADISVSNDADDIILFHGYTQAQASTGHVHQSIAHKCHRGYGRKVIRVHHIFSASE